MKKTMLFGLSLVAGMMLAPTANAETRYVQVTSLNQLQEGGKYAVGAVSNSANWTGEGKGPRFFSVNADNAVVAAVHTDKTAFEESMLWSLTVHEDRHCENTNASHTQGRVVSMHQNGQYIVQNGDADIPINATSTLALTDAASNKTEVEFISVPTPSGYTDSDALFTIHTGRDADQSLYLGYRAVKHDGALDRYSKAKNDNTRFNYFNMAMGDFTTYYEIYLQVDSENLTEAATSLWKAALSGVAETWTANVPAEEEAAELTAAIMAIPLPEGVEWSYDTLETQITEQIAAASFQTAMSTVVSEWVLGKTLLFKGKGRNRYMTANPSSSIAFGSNREITSTAYWTVEPAEGGFKLHNNNGSYVTSAPGLTDSADNACVYTIRVANVSTLGCWISPAANLGQYLHTNTDDGAIAPTVIATTTGDYSQWIIYGNDVATRFAAAQADAEAVIASYQRYVEAGLFVGEFDNFAASVRAIDYNVPEDLSTVDARLEAIAAEVAAAEAALWASIDGQAVAFQFNRLSAYITVNANNTLYAPATFAEEAIWKLVRTEGRNFKLYNPASGKWLIGVGENGLVDSEADANAYNLDIYSGSETALANTIVLLNTARTSNRCLHKSNDNGSGMIWYTNSDQGSAIRVKVGMASIRPLLFPTVAEMSSFSAVSTNFLASIAASGYGDARTAYEEALTSTAVDCDEVMEAIEAIKTFPSFAGAYITLTPQNYPDYKLHYTTKCATGSVHGMALDDECTEAQTIWLFHNNRLVNYSNGMHLMLGKGGATGDHPGCCITGSDNEGTLANFADGYQTEGTVQLYLATERNLHIHQYGGCISANVCRSTGTKNETEHNFYCNLVTSLPVAVHSDGWGSIYSPIAFSIPEESGYTFYGATLEEGELHLTECEVGTVYAGGTALLVQGGEGTARVNLEYGAENATDIYAGVFEGVHIAAPHTHPEGMKTFAKVAPAAEANEAVALAEADRIVNLTEVSGDKPANTLLYTVAENHADIQGTTLPLNVTRLTTGIERVVIENLDGTRAVYDLQGRRLAAPAKGSVNIINGRKVLVK